MTCVNNFTDYDCGNNLIIVNAEKSQINNSKINFYVLFF